jgi:hypothetical protein
MIGAYDHADDGIETAVLHEKLEVDDHDVPAILIRNDGHVLAFYSRHSKDDFYMRVSQHPGDITEWGPVKQLYLNDNPDYPADYRRTYCYANPFQLSAENNRIYLFWRGIDHKPTMSVSDDGGKTWSKGHIIISPRETYKDQRPYVKYASNDRDRIHIAFTDGHPRNEPANGIYYVCYRDGAFYHANGTRIGDLQDLPLDTREADTVYDARDSAVRAWIWDVAADRDGYPVIVYTRLPAVLDHRYHYARWDGEQWTDQELVGAGKWFPQTQPGANEREQHYSGGIVLDHSNPSVVYLSRPVDGVFEIEKWQTPNAGLNWSRKAVTVDSKTDNIRPFVPWRLPDGERYRVLWMTNEKYIHYTDFQSAIKMDKPTDNP